MIGTIMGFLVYHSSRYSRHFVHLLMPGNDLIDFMHSATKQMEDDYKRIQKRALEDPGTAGDEGEENWATLLRNWLPKTFHIVTKGRILSFDGKTSPQVDILILQPEYPPHLVNSKLYLAGGVLAAFECKVTLKAKHVEEFINRSIQVKHIPEKRLGTPQKELNAPILYSLLSHSHSWRENKSKADRQNRRVFIKFNGQFT